MVATLRARALDLDPLHDQALLLHANLAFVQRDYRTAEEGFRALLDAHPELAEGRLAYANFLLARHRFAESMAQLQTLRRQHPLLYAVPAVAWNYLMQGETERAWQEIQRITSTEPGSAAYHASAQHITWQRGDEELAMHHLRALMVLAGFETSRLIRFDEDFAEGGLAAVHARLLVDKETASLGHYRPPLSWARYALVAGNTEEALDHLEAALERRQEELLWMAVDPHYRLLHGEVRFQSIVQQQSHMGSEG
jgi:tetratricopeptide (TPR) repeat protein